jgi:MFS family permease
VIIVAGAAMVLETTLFAIMAPMLAHYRHEFGLSKGQAGILSGSYAMGTVFGSLPGAWLVTRIAVKRAIAVGLIVMAAASIAVAWAAQPVSLDLARLAQGTAGGVIWSASLTWVSELAPPERRGVIIGGLTGIAVIGSVLGPPVGALAVATSPETVFGSIPFLAFGLLLFVARLPSAPVRQSTQVASILRSSGLSSAALALWLIFASAMGLGLLLVLGPLRLSHLGAGAGAVAVTFAAAAMAEAGVIPLCGHLADLRGVNMVTVVALPITAGVLLCVVLPSQPALLALVLVLGVASTGAFWAPAAVRLTAATAQAGVSDVYAFALVGIAWSAGQSAGASGGAGLAQLTSDIVPFAILAFILVTTMTLVLRSQPLGAGETRQVDNSRVEG